MQVAEGHEVADVRPSTIEDLFEEAYRPMVRLALVMTGSNEVAEDLVQDCFARLHGRWEHVENPGGYMRISVVNACKAWFRSRDRERKRMQLVGAGEQVLSLETKEMLDALEALSPQQRAAIVLRYYEDLSEAEIAEALGCPPGTVKSHIHRGLAQLRKVVEP